MPFNYYDIVTVLTVIALGLAVLFFIMQNVRALWILAVACIPFSSEIVVEIPIQATNLPVLFFPTDFLAGITSGFIFLSLPFLISHREKKLELRQSRIFIFVALYFIWMTLSTVLSNNFVVSFKFLVIQLSYLLAYGGIGYYLMKQSLTEIELVYKRYLLGALLAVFFVCIVEHWILGINRETVDKAIVPFFREHTVYGAFTAWMFVAYFILWRSSKLSLGLMAAILFSMLALFLSYSRGGWLTAAGALLIVPILQWLWGLSREQALAVLVGAAALSALGIWYLLSQGHVWLEDKLYALLGEPGKRIASSFDVKNDLSNIGRIHRWIVAWELFKQEPVKGIGPNTFAEEYHALKNSSILFSNIKKSEVAYAGIHNEYLTALTEMGIPGLILIVSIYGLTLYYPFRYAFSAKEKRDRIIGLLVAVPLLSYYLHAFINNFMDHGKMAALIYLHWGAAMALEVNLRKKQPHNPLEYEPKSHK